MNNLLQNYKIILSHLQLTCHDIESFDQIRKPKLSNIALVALSLAAEHLSINIELQLFRCLEGTHLEGMIERSVYNKRRKKLFGYTEAIRKRLSEKFADFTDVFVVDSMPTPICKFARARRSNICSTYAIQPAFGHCALELLPLTRGIIKSDLI